MSDPIEHLTNQEYFSCLRFGKWLKKCGYIKGNILKIIEEFLDAP